MPIDYGRLLRENPNPALFAAALSRAIAAERAAGAQPGPTAGVPPGAPTVTSSTDVPEDVSRNQPSPTTPDAAAAASPTAGRVPPYPDPKDEYERARNAEQAIEWAIEDLRAELGRLDPEMAAARDRVSDNIRDAQTRLTAQQGLVQQARTAREAEAKKKPHTITKQERGPDGQTYVVTYDVDAAGNEKWNGQKPVKLDLGTDPTAAVDLATAQANLARLNQQLAAEADPNKQRLLAVQVEAAQETLRQSQAKAPLDLRTAELQHRTALEAFEQATSPEAKERARLDLETAKVGLDAARQGLARGNAPQVIPSDPTSPTITTRDPNTGAISTQPNPAYQGPTFADATAAYNAQVPRLQQAARTERDRLLELQRSGAISEADAEKQFSTWFGQNVETPLAGYRTAAEEAQRKEQRETGVLQRAEDARAEALNRERERLGLAAGQQARTELIGLAPQVRTPQFLEQMGQQVARMSARAGAPNAEAAANLPRGSTFTADTFNPANFQGVIPDLDAYAKAATERALSSISPAVAARIGAPMPTLPTGPTLQAMLAQTRYRGPLSGLPSAASGLVPTPGMNQALDIGGGRARTPYGPGGNVYLDWDLPR